MKQEMVGDVPGNVLGMMADLTHKLQHGVILPEEFGRFLKRQNPFKAEAGPITGWQNFYQKFFGLELNFSGVRIPEKRAGFDRLIIVAQGLTLNQAFDACRQNFKCWRYTEDLDTATKGPNEREPTQHYAIWVRDRTEADEELKNLSANQIKIQDIATETLLERLIHELKYWDETAGEHLDIKSITLCAGSRNSDGYVPSAFWYGDGLRVGWYDPVHSNDDLRARQVVS
jgi:hypothetical protein